MAFERDIIRALSSQLREIPDLIHLVAGPRQVGKTTAVRAVVAAWDGPARYAAADELGAPGPGWLRTQWELARRDAARGPALLVLDEVQKAAGWSEQVKGLWDADRSAARPLRVILLGSSALLLGAGVTESLAGRFVRHRCTHWSYAECRDAFGWDLDRWIAFGGYPGGAPWLARGDEDGWKAWVRDALIETVLGRDVLSMHRVTKPALLRHLFVLSCAYPAQALSYTKMLGQLQDAGNTTTLAHYLQLLDAAFLVRGLEKTSLGAVRSRGTSPKLVARNNALVTALDLHPFEALRADPAAWGRLVENAVGLHLVNLLDGLPVEIGWWRERDAEVDFVLRSGDQTVAIEVKSGHKRDMHGLDTFLRRFPAARPLVVGPGGMALEEFFTTAPRDLLWIVP